MSVRKDTDATPKVTEDDGFFSGPLSEQLTEELVDDPVKDFPDSTTKTTTTTHTDPTQLDSGLDLTLSEDLSNIKISDKEHTDINKSRIIDESSRPLINITEEKSQDIPPLAVLFQQDDDGDTQLHIAAVHGCQKSVSTLVSVCPDKMWLDVPNDYGHTALHLAIMSKHPVVARMLVRAGASLNVRDLSGETPLHIAAHNGDVECINALLEPVPNRPQRRSSMLNQKNYNGQTSVHLAATSGHVEALKALVFYGADINAREGLCGWTALHISAVHNQRTTAEWLVRRCAGVWVDARDYAGRTARRVADPQLRTLFSGPGFDMLSSESEDEDDESDTELFEEIYAMKSLGTVA